MNEELFINLSLVVLFLVPLPLVLAVIRWKKLSLVQRRLTYLVLLIAIVEFVSYLLWTKGINNHPIYHFYSVLEFILILNIYQSSMGKWFNKKIVSVLGVGLTLFALGNAVIFQSLFEFNSNVTTVSGVLIILMSLVSFYEMLKAPTYSTLQMNPQFWINAGLLLYISSNLVLFYLSSRMDLTYEDSLTIWGVHSVFHIILIIFYTVALWIQPLKD